MLELGISAFVVPVLAQHSPVSSSDISAEDVSEVLRFRARSRVQSLDSRMDFDSNEVGTVLGMHFYRVGNILRSQALLYACFVGFHRNTRLILKLHSGI